jgi:Kelch motif
MRPFRCFLAVAIASNLAIEIPVTARSRAANREQVRVGHVERAAPMLTGRSAHTATLLENGNVLITGGMRRNQEFYSSAELYDVSGRFRPAGNMTIARLEPAAVLLSSGKVLIAGGWVSRNCTDSAEIYDSATGKFTAIGRIPAERRASHYFQTEMF